MEIFSKIVSFLCWKLIRRTNTGELRRKERWWGEITLGKLYLYFGVNKDFMSGLSC